MTIHRAATLGHWNYFLALEHDLDQLSRFVDFSGNDDSYSLEIERKAFKRAGYARSLN